MHTTLVSVVIPSFNAERFIARALKSVFNQTYRAIEIIVIDNGSSDGTLAVVDRIKMESPFTVRIETEPQKGACAARNKGLEHAQGSWIQFLDADDELLPDKIEKDLMSVASNENCAFLLGGLRIVNQQGVDKEVFKPKSEHFWVSLMRSRLGQTSGMLWRTDAVKKVNGWNVQLSSSQEYDLIFRLLKSGYSYAIQEHPNTIIHMVSDSISHDKSRQTSNWRNFVELRKLMRNEGVSQHPELTEQLDSALFDAVRIWYLYDSAAALQFFKLNFEKDFKPISSTATSMLYVRLFKLFKFKKTQCIFALVRRLNSR